MNTSDNKANGAYELAQVAASADRLTAFFAREFDIDPAQLTTERDGAIVLVRSRKRNAEGYMELARIGDNFIAALMDAVPQRESVARIFADGTLFVRLLVSGDMDERIGDRQVVRLRGPVCTLTYLPPGVCRVQCLRPAERRRYFGLAVGCRSLHDIMAWSPENVPGQLARIYRDPNLAVPLLSAMPASWSMLRIYDSIHDCPYTGNLRLAYFRIKALELLIEALHAHPVDLPRRRRPADRRIDRAAAYVDSHIGAYLTLESVGRRVGLNRNALAAGFRESFGVTFYDYVLRARMRHAWDRLTVDGARVSVVAAEAGFRTRSGFTRAFNRCFGLTPRTLQHPE